MSNKPKLTDYEAACAHAAYMNGATYPELYVRYGLSSWAMRKTFHRLGLPLRGQPTIPRVRVRLFHRGSVSASEPYGLYIRSLLEMET
jgi:hypothetical protein